MNDIYDQHAASFKNTAAYVVLDDKGELVGRITFKIATAVTCYLHIIGIKMVRGRACGGGYDRQSAAAYDAMCKIPPIIIDVSSQCKEHEAKLEGFRIAFRGALLKGNGSSHWHQALRDYGFNVIQAV